MAKVNLNKLNKQLVCEVCGSEDWNVSHTRSIKTKHWQDSYNYNGQVLIENEEWLLYCECEGCSQIKLFNSQYDIELEKYTVTSEDRYGKQLP